MSKPTYFEVDLSHLSDNDRKVVDILKRVGEKIHEIWLKQVNEDTFETFFYPKDTTKEELTNAAKDDPLIFSAFSIVKRDEKGKLYAVRYRDEYKEELDIVVDLLKEAAKYADKDFSKLLLDYVDDCDKNDFERMLLRYVDVPDGEISILMGPLETYLDREYGVKKAFQFNLRVLRRDMIEGWDEVISLVTSKGLIKPASSTADVVIPEEIKLSIVDVIMFAGRQAGSSPSSTNLPNGDEELREHGTKIVFYWNSMNSKFDRVCKKYLPAIKGVVNHSEIEDLRTANLRMIGLHEICEAIIKYPKTLERLKGHYDSMRELNAFLMAAKNAKYLALNGYLTANEHKDFLITLGLYGLDAISRRKSNPSIMEYAKGFAVLFNFAMSSDAVQKEDSFFMLNFQKMDRMPVLTNLVLSIFSEGTDKDAKQLFDQYGSFEVFDKVLEKLA